MNEERKAMLAATLTYTIFGLSYLFSKMALNVTDPTILLWIRFTVTFICLNVLVLTGAAKINFRGKHIWRAVLLGVLQPVLYFVLENYGIMYTTTSFSGLMSSISPVFTAILGALLLREKPNAKQWACIAISIAGVMLVSVGGTGGQNTVGGCLCLLAAYFFGAFYSLLSRHISKEFTPFELTYMMFTVGFVFFTGWAFVMNGGNAIPMAAAALGHSDFIIAVLYLGILSSVVAYFLANYSLARLPVARSTVFTNMATIVSVLAGVILMGDPFTWLHALSFMLILAGVFGVNRFVEREEPAWKPVLRRHQAAWLKKHAAELIAETAGLLLLAVLLAQVSMLWLIPMPILVIVLYAVQRNRMMIYAEARTFPLPGETPAP